ncbi:MAG: TIGR00266 family protein [Chloroflexi bacterium]|nr:TIGR00266 family protein [Chloroflexota bacterium]
MRYRIFGDKLPGLTLQLDAGESIYTQSGGMSWMSDNFQMDTNVRGGLMKGLGRMLTGESLFMATYTAKSAGAEITLTSAMPGEIRALQLDGRKQYIAQKSSFLCAQQGVVLSTFVNKLKTGLFGGEGFLMQRLSGEGMVFLELDGSIVEIDLQPGQRLKVYTGNIAFFESDVKYDVETVKGFTNIFFGGEGLFLSVLEGPGKVWLQSLNTASFAARIMGFLPNKSG